MHHGDRNGFNENDREKREVMPPLESSPLEGGWWGNPLDHFEAGLTRAIPKAWIRRTRPICAKVSTSIRWQVWIASENPENEDELIALHGVAVNTDGTTFYPMFRIDYARVLGFDCQAMPRRRFRSIASAGSITCHDVPFSDYEARRAFRDGDADGNGKNDTIPFGASDRANGTGKR